MGLARPIGAKRLCEFSLGRAPNRSTRGRAREIVPRRGFARSHVSLGDHPRPILLDLVPAAQDLWFMSVPHRDEPPRRSFLRGALLAASGLIGSGSLLEQGRLLADWAGDPDPEVPNEEVARILREISAGRPIRRGHLSLDMPLVAEDGRIVPVIIESDLPMTSERYVKVHPPGRGPQPGRAPRGLPPEPGHRLGVHLYPDQDEAHHLGARAGPRPATTRSGRPMPACRSRSTGAADERHR